MAALEATTEHGVIRKQGEHEMAVLSKRAWWFWPIVFLVTLLCLWTLVPGRDNRSIYFLGIVAALGAFFYAVNDFEKKVALRQREADEDLLKKLSLDIQSGQSVKFSSSVLQSVFLSVTIVPIVVVLLVAGTLGSVLLALLLLIVVVYLLLEILMKAGRPTLLVDNWGITPYLGCFVEWARISGMYLEVLRGRGGVVVGHRLIFKVDSLSELVPSMTSAARVYYKIFAKSAFGRQIRIDLDRSNETPELIKNLCCEIWQRDTKRRNHWHPGMSENMHSALRSLEQWQEITPQFEKDGGAQGAAESLRQVQTAWTEFEKETAKMNDWRYGGKIPTWVAVLVIVLVLLALLLPVLKNIMR